MIDLTQTYMQTRDMSCGPSCIMMAVNYLKPGSIELNTIQEYIIHDAIKSKKEESYGYTMPSSICKYLLNLGMGINYFLHQEEGEIKNQLIKICFEEDERIRKEISNKSKFQFVKQQFTFDIINHELDRGRPSIVPLNLAEENKPPVLHWILLLGHFIRHFEDQTSLYYVFADPNEGIIKSYSMRELENKMYLYSGRLFLSVWI